MAKLVEETVAIAIERMSDVAHNVGNVARLVTGSEFPENHLELWHLHHQAYFAYLDALGEVAYLHRTGDESPSPRALDGAAEYSAHRATGAKSWP